MRKLCGNRRVVWAGTVAFWALLVGSVGGASGCRKKKPDKRAAGVRCTIDAKTIKEMAQHGDLSALPHEKRTLYYGLMLERCKGWPPVIAKLIAYIRRPYKIVKGEPTRGAPPKFTDADRADMRKRWNRLCPGYDGVAGKPGSKNRRSVNRYKRIWKHCGLAKHGAVTRWEFVAHRPVTKTLVIMYDELVRGGMKAEAARLLVHLWIPENWTDMGREHKVELPVSRSATRMADAVDVILSRTNILVRNHKVARITQGKVDANAKRDGPDGFFIDALFKKLHNETKKLRAAGKQGGQPFRGNLLLMADRRTPYRLLAEVLYTANQAGYSRYQILVSHPDEKQRVILIRTPWRVKPSGVAPGATPKTSAPVMVLVASSALVLKHPRAAAPLRFPFDPGQIAAAARRLSLALWKLRARPGVGGASGSARRIIVVPDPKTRIKDVVHLLDAVRVVPQDARKPPAPKGASEKGCGFVFQKSKGEWKLAVASLAGCMYPDAVLGLSTE